MHEIHGRARSASLNTAERRGIRRQWECAILLSAALAAASFAPHPIVLPIVSVVLVLGAAVAAGIAWIRSEGRPAGEFARWDQAGILLLAGLAAALTGDSADVIQFMEGFTEPRLAAR